MPKFPYTEQAFNTIEAAGLSPTKEQVEEILQEQFSTLDTVEFRKQIATADGNVGDQGEFFWRHRKLVSVLYRPLKQMWGAQQVQEDTQGMRDVSQELYMAAMMKKFTPRVMSFLDRCVVRKQCRELYRKMQREVQGSKAHEANSANLRRKAMILQEFED